MNHFYLRVMLKKGRCHLEYRLSHLLQYDGSSTLLFTFAVMYQGIAIVTRFAVLALWSRGAMEAAQALPRQTVAGIAVGRVDVAVAGTRLTAGARRCQVAVETRVAPVAALT